MATTGGLAPSPERYGGGSHALSAILDSLNEQRGTAYDTSNGSNVYAENAAFARALAAVWSQNRRLAYQFDPLRLTDFLDRWEAILGIVRDPGASDATRRANVLAYFQRIGAGGTARVMNDALLENLGPISFTVVHNTSASANTFTPLGWPFGNQDPTGAIDWYSTISQTTIVLIKPFGMSESDYYARVGAASNALDTLLPAWSTFVFVRDDSAGSPGFILGALHNLDNQRFT